MTNNFTAKKFDWLWQVTSDHDISAGSKGVAAHLIHYFNQDTGDAWPSVKRLAKELGMTLVGVRKCLRALSENGHITIDIGGGRHSNRYEMIVLGGKRNDPAGVNETTGQGVTKRQGGGKRNDRAGGNETTHEPFNKPIERNLEGKDIYRSSNPGCSNDRFDEFWKLYPRHVEIGNARKEFSRLVKSGVDPDLIIAGAKRYASEKENKDPQFTKYPAKWLKGECWLDEPAPTNVVTLPRRNTGPGQGHSNREVFAAINENARRDRIEHDAMDPLERMRIPIGDLGSEVQS